MKTGQFLLQILFIYACVGSTEAQLRDHKTQRNRTVSSYRSETAKNLSSAYVSFYNRHDSAGCMHTGLALASLPSLQISSESSEKIKENLSQARQYCLDDKVPRVQAIKMVRDSLKIINNHSLVTAD